MPVSVLTDDELQERLDQWFVAKVGKLGPNFTQLNVVWSTADCIKQLKGVQRERYDAIIAEHWGELKQIGAAIQGEPGLRTPKKYRSSIMRPWLDEHAEEFMTKGAVK